MIIWELPNMESGIFLHQNRDANHEDKHWKCKFGNILDSVDVSLFVSTNEQWDEQACPEHPSIEWRIFLLWFLCTSYVKCETTKSKPIMCDNDTCFSRKLCCWAAVLHLQCLHITMPMPPMSYVYTFHTLQCIVYIAMQSTCPSVWCILYIAIMRLTCQTSPVASYVARITFHMEKNTEIECHERQCGQCV